MIDEIVTSDLAQFGTRELKLAGKILSAYKTENDITIFLSYPVKLWMNRNSGNVFLSDEECNVAMINGEFLEDFISCSECGHEDFYNDFTETASNQCCQTYYREISK